ncbi:MAG: HEAT repeat domain-containing protein, partial [Candidatus Binatia bacterium]
RSQPSSATAATIARATRAEMLASSAPLVLACVFVAALAQLSTSAVARAAQPAAGSNGILAAADAGARVVVGRTGEPRKLDVHGSIVNVRVGQVLAGNVEAGESLSIVWEELSSSRPSRFEKGGRILVCLEPLPGSSIWRKRLPTPAERSGVMAVAGGGDAFVRDPAAPVVYALGHYLALGIEARGQAPGLAYLVDLVATADEGLAAEALAKLAAHDDLGSRLADGSQKVLVSSAAVAGRPERLRLGVLNLAGQRRLVAARAELVALTLGGPPVDAAAWMALGEIDGGLESGRDRALLESDRADMRRVGVRFLEGANVRLRLAAVAREDASPLVRSAAVARLVEDFGVAAIDDVLPSLADPDDGVRTAAAAKIGSLGAPVVPRLVAIIDDGSARARDGAVVALSFAGPDGTVALQRIAADHPDERTRKLAGLALGRFPGHEHN